MKRLVIWMVIIVISFRMCSGSRFQQNPSTAQNWETFKKEMLEQPEEMRGLIDRIRSFIHTVFEALKSSSFPTAVAKNISQLCKQDSLDYVHNLYSLNSLWALQSKLIQLLHKWQYVVTLRALSLTLAPHEVIIIM